MGLGPSMAPKPTVLLKMGLRSPPYLNAPRPIPRWRQDFCLRRSLLSSPAAATSPAALELRFPAADGASFSGGASGSCSLLLQNLRTAHIYAGSTSCHDYPRPTGATLPFRLCVSVLTSGDFGSSVTVVKNEWILWVYLVEMQMFVSFNSLML